RLVRLREQRLEAPGPVAQELGSLTPHPEVAALVRREPDDGVGPPRPAPGQGDGQELRAVEPHEAPVRSPEEGPVAGLSDRVDGASGKAPGAVPSLAHVLREAAIGIERSSRARGQHGEREKGGGSPRARRPAIHGRYSNDSTTTSSRIGLSASKS